MIFIWWQKHWAKLLVQYYRLVDKTYNYCWLILVYGWLCWLGGQTRRNQWLLCSQRGLKSAQCKAFVTSGWLVSSSGVHWITVRHHVGAFGPCDWPYGNLGSSWGIFTAINITGDTSRCSLVCSECSSKLLEHMLIYLASDWVILLGLLIPGDGKSSSSNLIKAQVR